MLSFAAFGPQRADSCSARRHRDAHQHHDEDTAPSTACKYCPEATPEGCLTVRSTAAQDAAVLCGERLHRAVSGPRLIASSGDAPSQLNSASYSSYDEDPARMMNALGQSHPESTARPTA